MRSALFLETIEEAKYVSECILGNDERFMHPDIYSLNPNIHAYLKKNNISSFRSSELMDEHFYDGIMDKCQEQEMAIVNAMEDQNSSTPPEYYVNTLYYYLRQIWRHYLWNIQFIDRCLSIKDYDKVYSFIYEDQQTGSPWIEDDQLYLGALINTYSQSRGIKFNKLEAQLPFVNRKAGKLNNIFKYFGKFIGTSYFRVARKFYLKDNVLLVPGPANNMNKVCLDLKQKQDNLIVGSMRYIPGNFWNFKSKNNAADIPIDFNCPLSLFRPWGKKNDDSSYSDYFDQVVNAIKMVDKDIFSYKCVDYRSMLLQKIETDLKTVMKQLCEDSLVVKKLLSIVNPTAVVSQMGLGIYGALGHWAKGLNIPAILISHGSHVRHLNKYAKKEHEIIAKNILTSDYEYLAVQSPLAREMAISSKKNNNIVNIKPAIWGRRINKKYSKNGILNVVHAGTVKFRHQRRFMYETADEYVSALIDICNAVKPSKNIRLIIKTRPQEYELSLDTFYSLLEPLSENTIIETEKPFSEILSITDLLISFSSTTIEEALVNDIPVLLYGGRGRYAHIPVRPYEKGNTIEKAVTFINQKDRLLDYFTAINQKGSHFMIPSKEFDTYRFKESEAVDFSVWFADKMKLGAAA